MRWAARLFRYPEWSGLDPTQEGRALTPTQSAAFLKPQCCVLDRRERAERCGG